MQLKEELTLIQCWNRTIPDYLHTVKALADEIALIDHLISDDDLTLYVLNGLGPYFREIAAPIRARETSLVFEKLHDLLMSHESYLRRLESATQPTANYSHWQRNTMSSQNGSQFKGSSRANGPQRSPSTGYSKEFRKPNNNSGRPTQRRYQPKCQLCDQMGHIAKNYPQLHPSEVTVNCASATNQHEKNGSLALQPLTTLLAISQIYPFILSMM
ncbi:hypothetical protein F2P56_034260 [Juglans regia]|uniref:Uncharacterized protein n=1 Tax=Juglans regia TaxID=51240 RepID=A0A833WDT3_JUGRE|nr:hypothetical protein F2P56_034260 [Juglans regia]